LNPKRIDPLDRTHPLFLVCKQFKSFFFLARARGFFGWPIQDNPSQLKNKMVGGGGAPLLLLLNRYTHATFTDCF
jgi:hypothetical protein